ncbi:MAG: hypothetical protein WAM91_16295 [Candidatus Acidiferrales bacterium]
MSRVQRLRLLSIASSVLVLGGTGCGPKVKLVDAIPTLYSGESHNDMEPNLSVDPEDPRHMVLTAFTPCPPLISTSNAPIYFSKDGGDTWHLNCIVPGNNPIFGTGDITTRFAGSGVLYAGDLKGGAGLTLNILRTNDFTSPTPMTVLVNRNPEDQPYTQAMTAGTDRVYIGNNNLVNSIFFGGVIGKTSSVDWSANAASAPAPAGFGTNDLEVRKTCGQDLPSVRPAIHKSGVVYVAFLSNESGSPCFAGSNTADLVVVRDDSWGSGGFTALTDSGDGKNGVRVATGLSMTWLGNLGQERVGSQLSIAVDPNDSQIVYVAWGDGLNPNNFTLHVRNSTDGGKTWSATDLKTVESATNPALAINSKGRVGFLYQKLVSPGTCAGGGPGVPCWETHFERGKKTDWSDLRHPLANVPDNAGSFPLGDYVHVLAVGERFYGAFSANNYPDKGNFYSDVKFHRYVDWGAHKLYADAAHTTFVAPSVDPFFFSIEE